MGIANDLAVALDPAQLVAATGITPDPWQAGVLRSTDRQIILNCARQTGKSTVVAALALHAALFEPGSLALLFSPSERQSMELFRKVMDFWRGLGKPLPTEAETLQRLELESGSRIVALPGTEATVRGYSGARLVIIDEAARASDELYRAVRPMLLVSGGRLILLSTPFGKRGFFHDVWRNGGDDWQRVMVTGYDCPRLAALLEQERRALPDLWFRAEYLCEFTETTDSVFTYEQVAAAITDDVKPLFGGNGQ